MEKMNKRETGAIKERLAAEYLKEQGFVVLVHNFYSRYGEIDLIAKEGEILCFVEVKYRSSLRFGAPIDAISKVKQTRIKAAARYYMMSHKISFTSPCRFDAVCILGDEITLYRNLF